MLGTSPSVLGLSTATAAAAIVYTAAVSAPNANDFVLSAGGEVVSVGRPRSVPDTVLIVAG